MMTAKTALLSVALASGLAAQLPQPGKQHKTLARQVGVWDASLEYLDFNTGKMATSKGTSNRQQPLGPFWLVDRFQAQVMGMPFKGMGTTGYDPQKKKMVGTWIDSMTPSLMVIEGNWDKDGKVLTMSGMGPGEDGEPVKTTLVTTVRSTDKHVFQMFTETPDGEDMLMMTITYTKRTRTLDKVRGR